MKTMKRLAAAALAVVTAASMFAAVPAQAAKKKNYWWNAGKRVEYVYQLDDEGKNGKWVKDWSSESTFKNGREISYKWTNYRTYDEKAQKMVNKKTTEETKYSWKKNNLKSVTHYTNGKKTSKEVYTLDKKGRFKSIKTYNKKGKLVSTETYKYNKKGRLSSVTVKYANKKKKSEKTTYSYKYWSGNKLKKETVTRPDGRKTVYEYNKKGIMTKSMWEFEDGSTTDTYNSKGQLTKTVYKTSDYSSTTTYTYDKKGHIKEEVDKWTNVWNDGTKHTNKVKRVHTVKTDSHGNITEDLVKVDGINERKTVNSKWKKIYY